MAVATLVSRITGLLRTVVLAAALGVGVVADAYNSANLLPNVVYELLLGGVLTSVVVPLLVHAQERDRDRGVGYAQRLSTVAIVGLAVATAVAVLAAPLLTRLFGIDDPTAFAAWAQVFYAVVLAALVYAAAASLSDNRRVAWTAVLVFTVSNWTGQLYYAPQPLAFVLHLAILVRPRSPPFLSHPPLPSVTCWWPVCSCCTSRPPSPTS
jgi:putative peptidoglycan lipid II flippase